MAPRAAALLLLLALRAPLGADAPGVPPITGAGPVDGRRPESEVQGYRRRLKVLRGFHDGGPLEEADLFRALGDAGVLPSLGQPFRPFHAPDFEGRWAWPVRAGVLSSAFGPRWGRRHEGIDIAANRGVPVLAAAGGVVVYAGDGLRGYGNALILRHDQNTTSLYAHNDELKAASGDRVRRGQTIALLGSTGRSTGPHVHFEIRRRRKAVDPLPLLPKRKAILR